MQTVSRRRFLGGAAGLAAGGYLSQGARPLAADPLGLPIGCQLYPVRDAIGKDFEGTLRELAAAGYKSVELCSPPGYQKSGFDVLLNKKGSEVRKAFQAAGLRCESSHYQFRELKENLDERIAWAKDLGLKQMVVSTFSLPKTATMADWRRAAEDLNKIGEKTKKAGLQAGFHNHNMEFAQIDGVLIYDALMEVFDPKLVKMQFQVAVISMGYKAAPYFLKYPGRFISLHLADWAPEKRMVPVGKGVVDWKELFTAAKTGGVKNYYVEMNMEAMKESVPYLRSLKV